jgi:hypothetical protein
MIRVNNKHNKSKGTTRFVCISDTHGRINIDVPDGDVLRKYYIYYLLFII